MDDILDENSFALYRDEYNYVIEVPREMQTQAEVFCADGLGRSVYDKQMSR